MPLICICYTIVYVCDLLSYLSIYPQLCATTSTTTVLLLHDYILYTLSCIPYKREYTPKTNTSTISILLPLLLLLLLLLLLFLRHLLLLLLYLFFFLMYCILYYTIVWFQLVQYPVRSHIRHYYLCGVIVDLHELAKAL